MSAPSAHDVCVIGGGITGAGVARDLSLRGLSVLLLEKGDWGGGTTGASSWMIHGGPRYLEFDWDTTRLSCQDAGHIVTIARNIVYRADDGTMTEARSKVVVNAAGPWVPAISRMAGTEVKLRPAKGIHIVYPHRLSKFAISAESIDGRDLLMVSHGGFTLLGTTDDDFYGDLDSIDVMADEVEYLLQAFERVFPAIRQFRPVRTTAGVRPTLYKWRRYEDELSRRYQIFDHSVDGVGGFVTIAGGKLSMYRLMAEETSDAVCRKLGHQAAGTTATTPLPGSESDMEPAEELARRF